MQYDPEPNDRFFLERDYRYTNLKRFYAIVGFITLVALAGCALFMLYNFVVWANNYVATPSTLEEAVIK